MNTSDILFSLRSDLTLIVAEQGPPPCMEPLPISSWVAMSLLQKSIRRNECSWALRAAATLFQDAPDRLWRRLIGIAFEDIGLADIETVGLVTAALGGKRIRQKMCDEWRIAAFLVRRLATARKCRAADDLLMTAEMHPAFEQDRIKLTFRPTPELLQIATTPGCMIRRAIAAWYAVGTHSRSTSRLRSRAGNPNQFFDHLFEQGVPETLVAISREGFKRGAEMLSPFTALLAQETKGASFVAKDDQMPAEMICGSVPSWCLDMYSREGKLALSRFLTTETGTSRWIRSRIPTVSQPRFLGGIVFRAEGGVLRNRRSWELGDALRRKMDFETNDYIADASEILELLRVDINVLNEVRNVR